MGNNSKKYSLYMYIDLPTKCGKVTFHLAYGHLLKDFVTNSYGKSYNHDSQSRPNESQLK